MDLAKKKMLAAKTLGVGKGRIVFHVHRLEEIAEAITKQDIRDLLASGAIHLREVHGRRRLVKASGRRRQGSVRKKIKEGKRAYVLRTRGLRAYLAELLKQERTTKEQYRTLRKGVRASIFRSKAHLKEHLMQEQL